MTVGRINPAAPTQTFLGFHGLTRYVRPGRASHSFPARPRNEWWSLLWDGDARELQISLPPAGFCIEILFDIQLGDALDGFEVPLDTTWFFVQLEKWKSIFSVSCSADWGSRSLDAGDTFERGGVYERDVGDHDLFYVPMLRTNRIFDDSLLDKATRGNCHTFHGLYGVVGRNLADWVVQSWGTRTSTTY